MANEIYRKSEISCNGIPISNDTLFRIDMHFEGSSGKANKISLYGTNWSLENLQYCPWCYDNIKDYDETGVDCGGSCRRCGILEIPSKAFPLAQTEIVGGAIIGIGALAYAFSRFDILSKLLKLFNLFKKPAAAQI